MSLAGLDPSTGMKGVYYYVQALIKSYAKD